MDPGLVDAQRPGDDPAHRPEGLLAHRRGGDIGLDRARAGDPQHRRIVARNVGHPAPPEHRAAHAGGLDEAGDADPHPAPAAVLLPVDIGRREQLGEQPLVIAAVDDPAADGPEGKGVARHQIAAPHGDAVRADAPRQRIDQAFRHQRGEAETDAAIGAGRAFVGGDGARGVVDEGNGVGAGQADQRGVRFQRRAERVRAIGAGIAAELGLDPEDPAVLVGRQRRLDHRVPGVVAALQMLQPVLGPLDGAAERARREGGDGFLGVDQHLHPEPAADIGRTHLDPRFGEAQELGDPVPQDVRHLGRREDLDRVVAPVVQSEAAAALDGRGRDPGVAEPARDDDRGGGEGIGVFIADETALEQDIAAKRLVHQRRTVFERPGGVGHRVFRLVLDIDQRGGVFGRVRVARDDRGDDLAGEADLGLGDQRPGGGAVAVPARLVHARGDGRGRGGEVGAGEDPDHAVQALSRRRVDFGNPRPRERAPEEMDVQASRRVQVVEEAAAAEDQRSQIVGSIARAQRSPPYQCSARWR